MTYRRCLWAVLAIAIVAATVNAQVGKGIADLNGMPETELAALPNMTPAAAKAFVAQRPFADIVEANKFLLAQGLTQVQLTAAYEKAFVHLNLNTATAAEIALIPRIAAARMAREFAEYRPWKTFAQFDREISKYVGQPETDRLKQYVFIPLDLNAAADADFNTIPNFTPRMLIEFKEYRPWKTKAQFETEIGKYVGPKETARLWRFVAIN